MSPILDYRRYERPEPRKWRLPGPWAMFVIFGIVSFLGSNYIEGMMPLRHGERRLDVGSAVVFLLVLLSFLNMIAVGLTRRPIATTVGVVLGLYPLFLEFIIFGMKKWRWFM